MKLKLWANSARASLSRRWSNRGASTYWPIAFAVMCCAILAWAIKQPQPEHWYEVRVLQQVGTNEWLMAGKPNRPTANDIKFRYRGCTDFPNSTVIWPGFWAREAIWDEEGSCKSILAAGRGFYWYTDGHNNVRRINAE